MDESPVRVDEGAASPKRGQQVEADAAGTSALSYMGTQGDAFTQQFSNSVEDLMQSFKAQAMQSFLMAERAMQKTHWAEMKALQTNHDQVLTEKNLRLDSLGGTRNALSKEVEDKVGQIKGLISLHRRMRGSQHDRHLLVCAMLRWNVYRRINSEETMKNCFVKRHHARRLTTAVWQVWSRYTRTASVSRRIQSIATQKEVERSSVIQDASLERERLECCVRELTEQLSRETLAKKNIQENLKTVFMRGVCALNFEAMSLLDNKPLDEIANEPLGQTGEINETMVTMASEAPSTLGVKDSDPVDTVINTSTAPSMGCATVVSNAVPLTISPRVEPTSPVRTQRSNVEQPKKFEPHPLPFVTYTQPKTATTKQKKWIDAPVKRVC